MKKLLSLFAVVTLLSTSLVFAQDGTATPVATTTSANSMQCIQTAVATREAAIGAAFTTFSTSMSSALTARATALNTAWGTADAKTRRDLRKKGWDAYQASAKKAGYDLKMSKIVAWDAFKTASKACKTPVVESEPSLGVAL